MEHQRGNTKQLANYYGIFCFNSSCLTFKICGNIHIGQFLIVYRALYCLQSRVWSWEWGGQNGRFVSRNGINRKIIVLFIITDQCYTRVLYFVVATFGTTLLKITKPNLLLYFTILSNMDFTQISTENLAKQMKRQVEDTIKENCLKLRCLYFG